MRIAHLALAALLFASAVSACSQRTPTVGGGGGGPAVELPAPNASGDPGTALSPADSAGNGY